MSDISVQMSLVAVAWLATVIFVARRMICSRQGSVGLPIAFLLSTTFLYCGAFTYAVPGYTHLRGDGSLYLQAYRFTERTVLAGAETSLLGILGFAVGVLASSRSNRRPLPSSRSRGLPPVYRKQLMSVLGILALLGFLISFVNIRVPLEQAASLVLRNLAVAFVCVGAALAVREDDTRYGRWLLLGSLIPAAYLLLWGYTSYGFLVLTVFTGFWLTSLAKSRWNTPRLTIVGAGVSYLLLSLFVAWMSFRDGYRAVVLSGGGLGQRLDAMFQGFSRTVLLSPVDFHSLDLVNARLSQTIFVGKAVELQTAIPSLRENGKTLLNALFAFVPRFLWPGKPTMNDNAFMAQNTGIAFSTSAAFGSGQVLEFYVNFGDVGVFLGFVVLGFVLRSVDRAAAVALRERRLLDHVRWSLVGLAFIAPLTSFFFIVNTAMMSWIMLTALKYVMQPPRRSLMSRPA